MNGRSFLLLDAYSSANWQIAPSPLSRLPRSLANCQFALPFRCLTLPIALSTTRIGDGHRSANWQFALSPLSRLPRSLANCQFALRPTIIPLPTQRIINQAGFDWVVQDITDCLLKLTMIANDVIEALVLPKL